MLNTISDKIKIVFKPWWPIKASGGIPRVLLEFIKYGIVICIILFVVNVISIISAGGYKPCLSAESFTKFFELYYYPIRLLVAIVFLATLAVATAGVIHSGNNVIEARKARDASYRPEIYLPIFELKFTMTEIGDNSKRILIYNGFTNVAPYLTIHNIGRGVAKAIDYQFFFEIGNAIEYVKVNDVELNIGFLNEIEENDLLIRFNNNFSDMRSISIDFSNSFKIEKIDYLPGIDITAPKRIDIPNIYLYLYIIAILIMMQSQNGKTIDLNERHIKDFPKLKLVINYWDIGNNPHNKTFDFKITSDQFMFPLRSNKVINMENIIKVEPIETNERIPI